MNHRSVTASLLGALALALVGAGAAAAEGASGGDQGAGGTVFVQTNEPSGNHIVVFDRNGDGTLTRAGTYATGGNGGAVLPGTESDRLASQGSLVYVPERRQLIAVNAGSNTVSAFHVEGDALSLENVVPSGGQFPASVDVHGGLAYVLNSGGAGIVQGFRLGASGLTPVPGSARSLGLANTTPPFFLTSPGQVGFTPDGHQLIVTTKASTSTIDVFAVGPDGLLSATPVANPSATPVPFAFTFGAGRLVAGEAGASSVTTYRLASDGTLSDPKSQADGQVALCWIQKLRGYYYVSNTGNDTISGYRISAGGQPSLVGSDGVVATTDPGPIDATASGAFLYVQTGINGTIDEFRPNSDGTLTRIGTETGLPAGIEGIAASS
jgi:6-phosphogluconolactonase (cycloisomerase 2 family)